MVRARSLAVVAAIIRMELTLRLRNPTFPLLLAFLLATCALLVPDPSAGYAIVTIDQKKPIMSAETALVAAGIVLGIMLLPVFALALDVGHARDRRNQLDRLQLTSPIPRAILPWARMLASLVFVLLTTLMLLVVVSSTIVARYGGVPAPSAMALFLLIVAPVGMLAALLAATFDRFLPERNLARTLFAFGAWMGAVVLSLVVQRDLFAIDYLKQTAMAGAAASVFALGVIETQNVSSIPWHVAPLTASFVGSRLALASLMVAVSGALAFLLRPRLSAAPFAGGVCPIAVAPREMERVKPAPLDATALATASMLTAVRIIVAGWMRRSRLAWVALAAALVLALIPGGSRGASIAVALTLPMIIISRTSFREVRVAATLEKTTAALFRPSPALMYSLVLALVALAPTLPALARMQAVQSATAVLGGLASTLWLTWTHRCVRRPLLGISTFAGLWYFDVFNDVPPALDFLGLWHASSAALLLTAVAASGMLLLVGQHDSRGDAASREVA
ncbi:MAG: hypothetical protein ACC742_08390 [Thermoanaerobaculales bacterium]